MNLTDFEAILFDMDGTLVDSEVLWRVAEKDTVSKHGGTLTEEVQALFLGLKVEESAEIMREKCGLAASARTLAQDIETRVKELLPEVKDQKGAVAFIEAVNGLELPKAIVSNSTFDIIETTLAHKEWSKYFEKRFSAEQVTHAKPAPDIYLMASEALNVNIKNCLVIEDSLTGVKAGVSAGATCIAIPEHEADKFKDFTPYVFESLTQALKALS